MESHVHGGSRDCNFYLLVEKKSSHEEYVQNDTFNHGSYNHLRYIHLYSLQNILITLSSSKHFCFTRKSHSGCQVQRAQHF